MIRPILHLILHLVIPGIVAKIYFKDRWKNAWLIMIITMVVDLDHLLASPIYDPKRCGIGFHPLHSYAAICVYALMAAIPKTRIIGIGLLLHMFLDFTDCLYMRCGW